MPTTRPRFFVTESDDLADALDQGMRRWPGLTRGQVLVRLALLGDAGLRSNDERRAERITAMAGACTGAYRRDERRELLEEWPE